MANSQLQQTLIEDEESLPSMSLVDHLQELRIRIFICLIAVTVGTTVAFIFRTQVIGFLTVALPLNANILGEETGKPLVITSLTSGLMTYLILSLVIGIGVALPVILYEIWAFVAPGLYTHEKKTAIPFIFMGVTLFAMGITLGYLMLSYPIMWFVEFASTKFIPMVTADSYFQFVAIFILAFGIIFELPLVLIFLAKMGIVSKETLKDKRPYVHFIMWVVAAFITPGADIYSPLILGAAMSLLYEFTILFITRFVKTESFDVED